MASQPVSAILAERLRCVKLSEAIMHTKISGLMERLALRREPNNVADSLAVAVTKSSKIVGQVKYNLALLLSSGMLTKSWQKLLEIALIMESGMALRYRVSINALDLRLILGLYMNMLNKSTHKVYGWHTTLHAYQQPWKVATRSKKMYGVSHVEQYEAIFIQIMEVAHSWEVTNVKSI